MISRIQQKLGTAGFIISIVALVAALAGGAYAAGGGLSSKQKKEVTKIAKKYAGKPGAAGAQGAAGPQGPAGPQGAAGANGKDGAKGDKGDPGNNGASATTAAYTGPECEEASGEAGIVVHSASADSYVCNGEDGQTGFTETLPPGATETGAVAAVSGTSAVGVRTDVPISFSIPLAAELDEEHVFVIYEAATVPNACENSAHAGAASATNPEASPGNLCVYLASDTSESTFQSVSPAGSASSTTGASTAGADLTLAGGEAGWVFKGTWAVTG